MMTTSAAVQEFSMFPEDREQEILSEEAVQFLRELDQRFEVRRLELLAARQKRQEEFDRGALPLFLRGRLDGGPDSSGNSRPAR